MKALVNHAQMLFRQSRQRVGTGELNRLVRRALEHYPPPLYQGQQPKVFYATQVSVQPPTLVLICNNPPAFSPQYRRYLLRVFRDQLSFGEVPIKLYLHKRRREDERDDLEQFDSAIPDQDDGTPREPDEITPVEDAEHD